MKQKTAARLIGISILFFLLFNFPFLSIWGKEGVVWGIPRLVFAVFFLWGLILLFMVLIIERKSIRSVKKKEQE